MAIARWRPANDLASLHSTMDRLFSDAFGDMWGRMGDGGEGGMAMFNLPVDIQETDNGYLIKAPVPGFDPEDVDVTFSDGVLTIKATRREEKEEPEGQYLRREIAFGNYMRRIALPGDVQGEGITATFENGVLTVEVPRASKPEPRRIQVEGRGLSKQLRSGEARQSDQQKAESRKEGESKAQQQQKERETSGRGASSSE
jgi:HSP20 family protein